MCLHENVQTIQEEVSVESWEEHDMFVQHAYDWCVCMDCGDDFACRVH